VPLSAVLFPGTGFGTSETTFRALLERAFESEYA